MISRNDGVRTDDWTFIAEWGVVVGRQRSTSSSFRPTTRAWYKAAERADATASCFAPSTWSFRSA